MATTEVKVPDIGDFKDVEVIEVNVKAGDRLAAEDPMITLESDKASMEVPAPAAGTVKEVKVKTGDRVSEGDLILLLETEAAEAARPEPPKDEKPERPKDQKPEAQKDEARSGPRRRPGRRRAKATSRPSSWCWARGRGATRRPSGRPISGSRPCWSSAMRRSAGSA